MPLLSHYDNQPDVIVLGLPRGGVPVAAEVATGLHAPLDVFVVRKLGVPGHDELAMGAIATGGIRVLNPSIVGRLGITEEDIERVAAREAQELDRRNQAYRAGRPALDVDGKTVVVVDDGLATGSTMRAAVAALRVRSPALVVVAVPVGAPSTCRQLATEADEVVCARMPEGFHAVGQWYDDFSPTTDAEIREVLVRAEGG
ncbi:MAG: phosphoribosyltransferase [Acidimicrobiales bacterium]|nr:phosphoribosyltransferase [Actinomycetota bacterium]